MVLRIRLLIINDVTDVTDLKRYMLRKFNVQGSRFKVEEPELSGTVGIRRLLERSLPLAWARLGSLGARSAGSKFKVLSSKSKTGTEDEDDDEHDFNAGVAPLNSGKLL
jgi:hypothetical protein